MGGGLKVMSQLTVTCLMCGKKYLLAEDHNDYKKLSSSSSAAYICDKCNHKVRYETEEQNKPVKPM